jgi:general secretion pathway protein G
MNQSRSRRGRGFTLIEVLMVLMILVIIAGFAVNTYRNALYKAKIQAAKVDIGSFKTPLAMYSMDIGMFPTTNQGLQALRSPPADLPNAQAWNGPYFDNDIPMDPWSRPYNYISPGRYNPDYDVWSLGPNGQDNSPDNIGNWSLGR